MEQFWGLDLAHSLFAIIDKTAFGLISVLYHIVMDLASAKIMSSNVIEDLYTRMYTLLGIFMLFRVTFSFVNYIINPDSFLDKTKGVQNIIKNVIIVLIMIIITPFAFDKLYELQDAIIGYKLIPKFIMGETTMDRTFSISPICSNSAVVEDEGDYVSLLVFKPFYQLDEAGETTIKDGTASSRENNFISKYCTSATDVSVSTYLSSTIYNAVTTDNYYFVNYRIFIGTIVAIAVCLLFISYAFDFAIRTIKLAFLQVIAPIPIMSYIDPASGKNGMFSKWLKQVASTWASLFIRLIALYFAILVITLFDTNVIKSSTSGEYMTWVMLFILIGALMFAKQVPKLIEELIPSMKLGGGLELNPFKRISKDALGGKALLGLGAAGLGMAAGSLSHLGYFAKEKKNEFDDYRELNAAKNRWKTYNDSINKRHDAGQISDAQWKRYGERADAKYDKALKAYEEKQSERKHRFSYKHPILSNVSQTLSGAKMGYAAGSSVKMPDLINIGKKTSSGRSYKDSYNIVDRAKEKATDFFGVKNDSGTTSILAGDIKKQEEILTRINRNIEMMNRQFSDLGSKMGPLEFSKAVSMGDDGKYQLRSGYGMGSGASAESRAFRDQLDAIIKQMNSLETQRLATTKEIKRLQKIKDKTPDGKKS